ncbi:3-hydroxyphenylacetate 6-hydroxylase [Purpureocillium takamizusanense]|uniref:3-hydroxyphenylacetate 6-hydroxylase n=1 Tax=Purpureocillium takamizusanense TaxID=2060973 RepID=A0A9Q8V5X4_9HYPO|nr:3-hydroxyphenylacetate 6-hydroxylase [Purpureocillium takamizusanense]UNI14225.1 3-hydroxyphenylacetate 6-hydroxylase [Purpureocillium takamizusanense]
MPLVSAAISEIQARILTIDSDRNRLYLSFVLLGSLLCLTFYLASPSRASPLKQFSGPYGWPIVGNFLSIYRQRTEKIYLEWASKHGDVFKIHLGYTPALVINSAASAKEILGRNSQAVASRPSFYTFHTIVSKDLGTTIGASKLNSSLKHTRKEIASEGSKPALKTRLRDIDLETRHLMRDLVTHCDAGQTPVDMYMFISRLGLSLMMTLCYGRRMHLDDPLTAEIIDVEDQLLGLRSPSGNYLDYLPFLRKLPSTPLARRAASLRDRRDAYVLRLKEEVDEKITMGTYVPCLYTKNHFSPHPLSSSEVSMILVTLVSSGLATATNTVRWCMTLLATRPDLQDAAYKAIREVYPTDREAFEAIVKDEEEVPYISALVRETLRVYSPARVSLPRASVQEFQYQGKTVPADVMIIHNAWGCNMDPRAYGDPEIFRPERWIENPDLPLFSFGLGYRMCPSLHFALREVYTMLMRIIVTFSVSGAGVLDPHPISGCGSAPNLVTGPENAKLFLKPRDSSGIESILASYDD